MRIVAGAFKGRKIELPPGSNTRPTKDRVREAIFSSLTAHIDFAEFVVCDLYAGSGALGLEALSRGCAGAVFCERQRELCERLQHIQREWRIDSPFSVITGSVERSLPAVAEKLATHANFRRLVFADPPYAEHPGQSLVADLIDAGILRTGDIAVIESAAGAAAGAVPGREFALSLNEQKSKTYGDTLVSFYFF